MGFLIMGAIGYFIKLSMRTPYPRLPGATSARMRALGLTSGSTHPRQQRPSRIALSLKPTILEAFRNVFSVIRTSRNIGPVGKHSRDL